MVPPPSKAGRKKKQIDTYTNTTLTGTPTTKVITYNYGNDGKTGWNYSSNGTPRVHKDGVTALKYDYSYDSIGRLIRTDISKASEKTARLIFFPYKRSI